MNERITKPQHHAPTPVAQAPAQPYTPPQDAPGQPMRGRERENFAGPGGRSPDRLTRSDRLLVTVFVTMFGTMLAAGALGFTTLSGQLLDMQRQIGDLQKGTSAQLLDMQRQIGDLRTEVGKLSAQLLDRMDQLSDRMDQLSDRMDQLSDRMDQLSDRMDQLSDRMDQLSDRVTRIETHLVPASDAQDPAGP